MWLFEVIGNGIWARWEDSGMMPTVESCRGHGHLKYVTEDRMGIIKTREWKSDIYT